MIRRCAKRCLNMEFRCAMTSTLSRRYTTPRQKR
ncbi:Uncharacterised protein [Vibrio cholerae]|nr:Uncharacterised protein [Vibrio cholerae]